MSTRDPLLLPELFAAALGLALADGGLALLVETSSRAHIASPVLTFVVTAGVDMLPLVGIGMVACALARAAVLRPVVRSVHLMLGPRRGIGRPLSLPVYMLAIGAGTARASIIGRHLIAHARPETAASVTAGATLAFAVVALVVGSLVCSLLRLALRPLERSRRAVAVAHTIGALLVAAIILVTMRTLLPGDGEPQIRPAAVALAFGLAASIAPVRERLSAALSGRQGGFVCATALFAGSAAYAMVSHLPGRAELAVVYRTAYAAPALAVARSFVDRDGDGYSPILGGGDCNDHDATIHPGAHDVPGNGIDEDCTGQDAPEYVHEGAPLAAARPPPSVQRPNIVVLHLDTVRPDHLGFGGYPNPTSPELDRFRASAVWFRRTYTVAPSTRFAMASMFTGLDIDRIPQHRDGARLTLLPDAVTVAERLEAHGYDGVGVTFPYVLEGMPGLGQGFRVWEAPWPSAGDEPARGDDDARTTDAALAHLVREPADGSRPFFFYVHYKCAHRPYLSKSNSAPGRVGGDPYDETLARCDHEVGRLLAPLEARGDWERTAVIVLSDHGEMLGEHGLSGHGVMLFEPAVRALLLVRIPSVSARVVDEPVVLSDIAPTLVALAGAEPLPASNARDVLALTGEPPGDPSVPRPVFLYVDDDIGAVHIAARGVVEGRFKYVRDVATGIEQLFDLVADPKERRNLRRRRPDVRAHLATLLEAWDAFTTSR